MSKKQSRERAAHIKRAKALILLSGGLDSRLVCKMLQEQMGKASVEAVFFVLPFGGGCCNDKFCVFKFCQKEGIKLHITDCTKGAMFRKYAAMIMKPKFQRGVALNPCIDCRIFMLKEAKKLAKRTGADIIATGEVLGERPLSQHRAALQLVEREAGLEGRLLRPLSAKLLPETQAERKGWIDRSRLLCVHGRRRVEQIALAKKYRISFPSPGGGCLLTDKEYSSRLTRLTGKKKSISREEIELAKLGRHFSCGNDIVIVGRNHQENLRLASFAMKLKLPVLEAEGYMGPATLIVSKGRAEPPKTTYRDAALLTARYSDAPKGRKCTVLAKSGEKLAKIRVIAPHDTAFLGKNR